MTAVAFSPTLKTLPGDSAKTSYTLAVGTEAGALELWEIILSTASDHASVLSAALIWQASKFTAHSAAVKGIRWEDVGVEGESGRFATCSDDHSVRVFVAQSS